MQRPVSLSRVSYFMFVIASLTVPVGSRAAGPDPVLLWPDGAPGALGDDAVDRPEIRAYPAPKESATGTAIVVCPGGGYGALATDHEGQQVARWLNTIGVSAFVLKYRLGPRYHHPAPMHDVQRAIRYVRHGAAGWGIAKDRIGVMGFSAGGHLASTAATHFDAGNPAVDDTVDRQSCRPDFAVLAYPVISFQDEFTHKGSRRNLLGDSPDSQLVELLSNELQVTPQTPPTFLFHTGADPGVLVENSLAFYAACRKNKVPAELHVYQDGPHGVGLAPGNPVLATWKDRLADWLKASGFLADGRRAAVQGKISVGGNPLRWGAIAFLGENVNAPHAWAIVNRGNYNLAEATGPIIGTYGIEIHNFGSVEPVPTIENVELLSRSVSLRVSVVPGVNEFDFDLTANAE